MRRFLSIGSIVVGTLLAVFTGALVAGWALRRKAHPSGPLALPSA
jgi:hypothetical protein